MVRDLATVTDGRYRRVRVDDKTLDIEVLAPEKDDWVPVRSLSQGTLDLVYLVARLGLVRLVTGDRRPPLVFDDPFVTLDDARAARALGLLKSVATDFQVIYLTTSARYDEAADAVVAPRRPDERRHRRGRSAAPGPRPPRIAGDAGTAHVADRTGSPPERARVRPDDHGRPRSPLRARLGRRRLRRRAAVPADAGVRRRPRLAARRDGDRPRPRPRPAARPRRCPPTSAGACWPAWPAGSASPPSTTASRSGGWASSRRSPAVLAALIPVAAGIVARGPPARRSSLVGIGLAIVAVVLVSRVRDDGAPAAVRAPLRARRRRRDRRRSASASRSSATATRSGRWRSSAAREAVLIVGSSSS